MTPNAQRWGSVLLVVAIVVVVVQALWGLDPAAADWDVALFGFLAAPFKLIGKGAKAVAKGVAKGVSAGAKFAARTVPSIASEFLGVPLGGGRAPPFAHNALAPTGPGFASQPSQDFPVSDRFSLTRTLENALNTLRGEAEKVAGRVNVSPKLSGPLPVLLGVAATIGVIGLVVGAVALGKK